jgi:hypothetical protein
MCWNKEISFLTFFIGTLFNILLWNYTTNGYVRIIALLWQFVLFMQIFEGLSWISKETNNKSLSIFSTYGAFIFNILQPIIFGICCIYMTTSIVTKYILIILMGIYLLMILFQYKTLQLDKDLYKDADTCHHLVLYWWDKINIFPIYILLLIIGCLSIEPLWLGISQLGYIFITLIISTIVYPCSYGSIWCWFAAFAPLFTYILIRFQSHNI